MGEGFVEFVRRATRDKAGRDGPDPYDYQVRLARQGLPQALRVPTGAGKTQAAVLAWLWRRLAFPRATPQRLVYVLPQRSLVEQTIEEITKWLDNLDLRETVGLYVLMGGVDRDDDAWQLNPAGTAIHVGTQDMILSRLLLRGYGEPRAARPVSFGLLHSGTQFVFDETQLMGPAVPTSAQLQGLREALGTAGSTATMWMSATLDTSGFETVDAAPVTDVVELSENDRAGELGKRLAATRTVRRLDVPEDAKRYPVAVAEALAARHVTGSRTIAVFNTVGRATAVYEALRRRVAADVDVVLLHSRFRPPERRALTARVKRDVCSAGQILVTTQVAEAGIDVSSRTLFTEAAVWSSIVQRAGRCNRYAEYGPGEAELLWASPPSGRAWTAPYVEADVIATVAALSGLEAEQVTSERLGAEQVYQEPVVHPVLRRRDLLQLFDTMPDVSGRDIDVSQWIRDAQDTTALVAWRDLGNQKPGEDEPKPAREELCPAPLADLHRLVGDRANGRVGARLWYYDQVEKAWRRALSSDVRPGVVLLADAVGGGYDVEVGWAPNHRRAVPVVDPSDVASRRRRRHWRRSRWVRLDEHLSDVEHEAIQLAAEFDGLLDLSDGHLDAAALAGRYHDLGKAHEVFQRTLGVAAAANHDAPPGAGPWAKSPWRGARHERRYFRHELVSALALLHPDSELLTGVVEADLVAYLAGAHHGQVRVSVRSVGTEPDTEPPTVLGVRDGDLLPEVALPGGQRTPVLRLDPSLLFLGAPDGGESWSTRVLRLRDRPDLGPFRLGFLEALVRVADRRASRAYEPSIDDADAVGTSAVPEEMSGA